MPEQENFNGTHQIPAAAKIFQMSNSYRIARVLYVAAKLGIADLLKDGSKSSDELAESVGVHPHALYRVLRVLASQGIFAEIENGRFERAVLSAQPLGLANFSMRAASN